MKIILNTDVEHLGEEGDVVETTRGYARNYLFPRHLALPFTSQNISVVENRRTAIEQRKKQKMFAAQSLREQIESLSIAIPVPVGDTGRLFGSVHSGTISEHLASNGIHIAKRHIELSTKHIKVLGNYTAKIHLYSQENALCKFSVISDKVADIPAGEDVEAEVAVATEQTVESVQTTATEPAEPAQLVAELLPEPELEVTEQSTAESAAETTETTETAEQTEHAHPVEAELALATGANTEAQNTDSNVKETETIE